MKKSKWPLLIIAASMLYGCTGNGEPDTQCIWTPRNLQKNGWKHCFRK